ncbi:MAG: hypothetical protein Salg2KO_20180 [Salibacteraceae bacterium]
MKSRIFFGTLVILGSIIILQSNAGGPASNGNRATGAPGDGSSTCQTCHSGGSFGTVSIDFELLDSSSNDTDTYIPGATYEIKVAVTASMGTPNGYGFQMICLDKEQNAYDGWSNNSANSQLSTANGRAYVEHDGISDTNVFTVEWTAPDSSAGDVRFYIGANAVNGNGTNSGDQAALRNIKIDIAEEDEEPIDSTNSISTILTQPLKVFPNPTTGLLNIDKKSNATTVDIYSTAGQFIDSRTVHGAQIDLTDQPAGFYLIKDSETGEQTKVFKL